MKYKFLALLPPLLSILTGCGSIADKPYHFDTELVQVECSGSCSEILFSHQYYSHDLTSDDDLKKTKLNYYLGVVEFDDQGLYHHREQRNQVFLWLRQQLSRDDAIVISYTHGWKHNANNIVGGDFQRFNEILKQQAIAETELTAAINANTKKPEDKISARKVIGLYTGWRGAIYKTGWLNNLTFWNRKKTAQIVGLRDGKDYFSELDSIVKQSKKNGRNDNRLVISGHSFGALLVHSAINGNILNSLNTQGDVTDEPYKIYGDQVILINPAFEAMDISNLVLRSRELDYNKDQRPLYLLLSSESDDATGKWFRRGRFFSTLFRNYHDGENEYFVSGKERKAADRTAIGSFDKYMPYRVELVSSLSPYVAADNPESPIFDEICSMWSEWRNAESEHQVEINMLVTSDEDKFTVTPGNSYRLVSLQKKGGERADKSEVTDFEDVGYEEAHVVSPKTPFIFARVDAKVLDGHGLEKAVHLWEVVSRMVVFASASQDNLDLCEN